jgi:uncharacterized protein YndB with AHSA1/START domain
MSEKAKSQFVYVTYVRTTPERPWEALTHPQFMRQYWFGVSVETEWKKGAPWRLVRADGTTDSTGEILEIDPPRSMVIGWQNERSPELKAEGPSRCTITIDPADSAVKLTISHEIGQPESKLIMSVSGGWPRVVSNLKSLLETGSVVLPPREGRT